MSLVNMGKANIWSLNICELAAVNIMVKLIISDC